MLSVVLGTFATKSTRRNIEYKEIEIEYNPSIYRMIHNMEQENITPPNTSIGSKIIAFIVL